MRLLPFFLPYLVPLSVVLGYLGRGGWLFLTPIAVYFAIPALDLIAGRDTQNPTDDEARVLQGILDFRVVTWGLVAVQTVMMFWGAWVVSTGDLTWLETFAFTLSVGSSGGIIGINVAHELVHKHDAWENFLGKLNLFVTGYTHWGLEHIAGHHAHVATSSDPATARLGETFYRFWPRTVFGSMRSAYRIEKRRLARRDIGPWSLANRVVRDFALTVILLVTLTLAWGLAAPVFFILQSLVAISLLEVVNYIEHYGLLRARDENGNHERVFPKHSWNASERVTNFFLFNLQRHSDHHYKPTRRYQILRHQPDAPQLPTGYGGMLLLALVPPLWFRVMDPRVPEQMKQLREKEIAAGALPS
jgi:alkane 1-monooxygenase